MTRRIAIQLAFLLAITTVVAAQRPQIPELVANAGRPLGFFTGTPSGPAPELDDILVAVDFVVRGVIGEGFSYLSDDKTEVYTDYTIQAPVMLYPEARSARPTAPKWPSPLKVTILGGTVPVGSFTFNSHHEMLPSLEVGAEYLLLLEERHGRFFPAQSYYGAFRVHQGRLQPQVRKSGFAPSLVELPPKEGIQVLVRRTQAVRARGDRRE